MSLPPLITFTNVSFQALENEYAHKYNVTHKREVTPRTAAARTADNKRATPQRRTSTASKKPKNDTTPSLYKQTFDNTLVNQNTLQENVETLNYIAELKSIPLPPFDPPPYSVTDPQYEYTNSEQFTQWLQWAKSVWTELCDERKQRLTVQSRNRRSTTSPNTLSPGIQRKKGNLPKPVLYDVNGNKIDRRFIRNDGTVNTTGVAQRRKKLADANGTTAPLQAIAVQSQADHRAEQNRMNLAKAREVMKEKKRQTMIAAGQIEPEQTYSESVKSVELIEDQLLPQWNLVTPPNTVQQFYGIPSDAITMLLQGWDFMCKQGRVVGYDAQKYNLTLERMFIGIQCTYDTVVMSAMYSAMLRGILRPPRRALTSKINPNEAVVDNMRDTTAKGRVINNLTWQEYLRQYLSEQIREYKLKQFHDVVEFLAIDSYYALPLETKLKLFQWLYHMLIQAPVVREHYDHSLHAATRARKDAHIARMNYFTAKKVYQANMPDIAACIADIVTNVAKQTPVVHVNTVMYNKVKSIEQQANTVKPVQNTNPYIQQLQYAAHAQPASIHPKQPFTGKHTEIDAEPLTLPPISHPSTTRKPKTYVEQIAMLGAKWLKNTEDVVQRHYDITVYNANAQYEIRTDSLGTDRYGNTYYILGRNTSYLFVQYKFDGSWGYYNTQDSLFTLFNYLNDKGKREAELKNKLFETKFEFVTATPTIDNNGKIMTPHNVVKAELASNDNSAPLQSQNGIVKTELLVPHNTNTVIPPIDVTDYFETENYVALRAYKLILEQNDSSVVYDRCNICMESVASTERHCIYCHQTFDKKQANDTQFQKHQSDCKLHSVNDKQDLAAELVDSADMPIIDIDTLYKRRLTVVKRAQNDTADLEESSESESSDDEYDESEQDNSAVKEQQNDDVSVKQDDAMQTDEKDALVRALKQEMNGNGMTDTPMHSDDSKSPRASPTKQHTRERKAAKQRVIPVRVTPPPKCLNDASAAYRAVKAAILDIEAAIPLEAVKNSNDETRRRWLDATKLSYTVRQMAKRVYELKENTRVQWIRVWFDHIDWDELLRASCTESQLAMCLWTLDRALIYNDIEYNNELKKQKNAVDDDELDIFGDPLLSDDDYNQNTYDRPFEQGSCEICQGGEQEDKILLCDSCDRGFHTFCLDENTAITLASGMSVRIKSVAQLLATSNNSVPVYSYNLILPSVASDTSDESDASENSCISAVSDTTLQSHAEIDDSISLADELEFNDLTFDIELNDSSEQCASCGSPLNFDYIASDAMLMGAERANNGMYSSSSDSDTMSVNNDGSEVDNTLGGFITNSMTTLIDNRNKECVELQLSDSRKLVCTPDHQIYTTIGWRRADELILAPSDNAHQIICGVEGPIDDVTEDNNIHFQFKLSDIGRIYTLQQHRYHVLAIARLLGSIASDGCVRMSDSKCMIHIGHRLDAEAVLQDLQLLGFDNLVYSHQHPESDSDSDDSSNSVTLHISSTDDEMESSTSTANPGIVKDDLYCIRLPTSLSRDLVNVGQLPRGKRLDTAVLPQFVENDSTPNSVVREFMAAYFGGDGGAPVPGTCDGGSNGWQSVTFFAMSSDSKRAIERTHNTVQRIGDIISSRFGVTVTSVKHYTAASGNKEHVLQLSVDSILPFYERIGFRYCCHKQIRLMVAATNIRAKSVYGEQRKLAQDVAEDVRFNSGVDVTWRQATDVAHDAVDILYGARISDEIAGNSEVIRLAYRDNAVFDVNRSVKSLSTRAWIDTVAATEFFAEINRESAQHTYAVERYRNSLPYITLTAISRVNVGQRHVYDVTVADTHNFIANGITVHNCLRPPVKKIPKGSWHCPECAATMVDNNPKQQKRKSTQPDMGGSGSNKVRDAHGRYLKGDGVNDTTPAVSILNKTEINKDALVRGLLAIKWPNSALLDRYTTNKNVIDFEHTMPDSVLELPTDDRVYTLDSDQICQICTDPSDERGDSILCDYCDCTYHINCLSPPLLEIPAGDWYCNNCYVIVKPIADKYDTTKKKHTVKKAKKEKQLVYDENEYIYGDEDDSEEEYTSKKKKSKKDLSYTTVSANNKKKPGRPPGKTAKQQAAAPAVSPSASDYEDSVNENIDDFIADENELETQMSVSAADSESEASVNETDDDNDSDVVNEYTDDDNEQNDDTTAELRCDVCYTTDYSDNNPILECEQCNTQLHAKCYGLDEIPSDEWLCDVCIAGVQPIPPCVLCGHNDGAMKVVKSNNNNLQWCHVSCAIYTPAVYFENITKREPIAGIDRIDASRFKANCQICHNKKGAPIQCTSTKPKCNNSFHASCALKTTGYNLHFKADTQGQNTIRVTLCPTHNK